MKRDIFAELMDGLEALADERQGKVMLRTHNVEPTKLAPDGRATANVGVQAIAEKQSHSQRIGTMKAKLLLPEDFDAPLPDDMLDDFESTQI